MNKPKVVFAPGCFDNFEGTQEELDEIMTQIRALAESGELMANSVELDPSDVDDAEQALLSELIDRTQTRRLH